MYDRRYIFYYIFGIRVTAVNGSRKIALITHVNLIKINGSPLYQRGITKTIDNNNNNNNK